MIRESLLNLLLTGGCWVDMVRFKYTQKGVCTYVVFTHVLALNECTSFIDSQ